MRWKRVPANRVQPTQGSYSDWKTEIANDCWQQCVYCAISETVYGGIDNFHIDHFRPLSTFDDLTNVITNLFLACAICNRFKSNDWPADDVEDHSLPSYPDPSAFDYNDLFEIDLVTYLVSGRFPATVYLTEKLYLNRPQLLIERRSFFLKERIDQIHESIRRLLALIRQGDVPEALLTRLIAGLIDLSKLMRAAELARPYEREDVRRPG